ncbi:MULTISPECIES: iron-containing alcohol dehydrogenase [unclassified Halanaerobium]|uniref:iron-containing alcohol dehydrogenase n=1 Tax=unclassified Halanaerobium TaxID=2641197 RepID=UPI000DF2639B|nr:MULTISPECIES: iron-containing alcohol dehydrogenase [unclassified Halanaerobium]RCW45655.1 alcohol dehydrogenase [Halanaerobium sp. MA284_MarDTE_T2]RCW88027.1 alcohol dehydrogenase [Halanaerobium sp. DL-01]
MNSFNFEFQIKTKIKFGSGKRKVLPQTAADLECRTLMIVVDEGIKKAGILDMITAELDGKVNYVVFDKVKPDPTIDIIDQGVKFAIENTADALLAVGGGSPIDSAKAVRAVCQQKELNEKCSRIPLITVPTTSGSGSEVTKAVVIKDEKTKNKFSAVDESLIPDITVVDPELTRTLPPYLTAISGMDALSHCIESYVSQDAVLPFEMIATKGVEMVKNYLRPAVGNGNNMKAREGMSLASLFGGIALSNCGLGLVHAIAHPLGGRFKIPHGLANTILLPHVMKFNIITNPTKFANVARLLGVNISNMTEMEAARRAADEVKRLTADIGLPTGLKEFGVDSFEEVADLALEEVLMLRSNPRPVKREDIIKILKDVY